MHVRALPVYILFAASFGCSADTVPTNDCASLAARYRNACPLAPGSEGEDVQEVVEICEELNALDDPTRCGAETRDIQRCIARDWGGLLGVLCGDTLLDTACVEEAEILEECLVENPCGAADQCDGECVDRLTDPDHCGRCGNACAPGQSCVAGSCSCTANTEIDPLNCGTCGNRCNAGDSCVEGECSVVPGLGEACPRGTCAAPFFCSTDWGTPVCRARCNYQDDCNEGRGWCLDGTCTDACQLFTNQGCPEGTKCTLVRRGSPSIGRSDGRFCAAIGSGVAGDFCRTIADCQENFTCGAERCIAVCNAENPCADGSCQTEDSENGYCTIVTVRSRCDRLWTTMCERFDECGVLASDANVASCVAAGVDFCCSGSNCVAPDDLESVAVSQCDDDLATRSCAQIEQAIADDDLARVFPSSCDFGDFLFQD